MPLGVQLDVLALLLLHDKERGLGQAGDSEALALPGPTCVPAPPGHPLLPWGLTAHFTHPPPEVCSSWLATLPPHAQYLNSLKVCLRHSVTLFVQRRRVDDKGADRCLPRQHMPLSTFLCVAWGHEAMALHVWRRMIAHESECMGAASGALHHRCSCYPELHAWQE
jgi:hypothetical protein